MQTHVLFDTRDAYIVVEGDQIQTKSGCSARDKRAYVRVEEIGEGNR